MASSPLLSTCLVISLCAGAAAWVAVHEGIGVRAGGKNEFSASLTREAPVPPAVAERPSDAALARATPVEDGASAVPGAQAAAAGPGNGTQAEFLPRAEASPEAARVAQALPEGVTQAETAALPGTAGAESTASDAVEAEAGPASGDAEAARLPLSVSGALTDDAPVQADAVDRGAALVLAIDSARAGSGPAQEGGAEVKGAVRADAPAPQERREDSVVTGAFVHQLAGWLAESYAPSRQKGKPGSTSATLAKANSRFSSSRSLRSLERDPLKARASVLRYVFQPNMLEVLYRMYGTELVEGLELAARRLHGGTALDDRQAADMFFVYAGEFRRVAASLQGASRVDIRSLAGALRRAVQGEAAANEDFGRAFAAHALAREGGNAFEAKMQSSIMVESARVASMYAKKQDAARKALVSAIRKAAGKPSLDAAETLFLGEWLARHDISAASMKATSDIFRRMAEDMDSRAREILFPAPKGGRPSGEKPGNAQPARQGSEAEPADVPAVLAAGTGGTVQPGAGQASPASAELERAGAQSDSGLEKVSESSEAADVLENPASAAPAAVTEVTGVLTDVRPAAPLGTVAELLKAMEMKSVSGPIPVSRNTSR